MSARASKKSGEVPSTSSITPAVRGIRASRVVSSIKRLGATEQSTGATEITARGLWLGIWASLARSDANARKTNRINGDQQRGVGNQVRRQGMKLVAYRRSTD